MNIYELVTNRIIEKLEKGVVPWRKPWGNSSSTTAVNWTNQKAYRGINTLLLEPGEYATFNQIKAAGGKVKKGLNHKFVSSGNGSRKRMRKPEKMKKFLSCVTITYLKSIPNARG